MATVAQHHPSLFAGQLHRKPPGAEGDHVPSALRSRSEGISNCLVERRTSSANPALAPPVPAPSNGLRFPSLWEPGQRKAPIVPAAPSRTLPSDKTNGAVKFPELPTQQYEIIYADPPWDYKGQLQHAGPGSKDTGGAIRHYPTVTSADLKGLNISRIAAPNCLLFMWATSPHLDQAIDLGKAWGFAWATVAFVWDKVRVNPGFYTLSQCELCLVFRRGKIPRPRGARNVRQMVSAKRGPHSTKPGEVRQRIDQMFPEQNKIELFGRYMFEGWQVWGLDVSNGT